jgi:hypothetical protein
MSWGSDDERRLIGELITLLPDFHLVPQTPDDSNLRHNDFQPFIDVFNDYETRVPTRWVMSSVLNSLRVHLFNSNQIQPQPLHDAIVNMLNQSDQASDRANLSVKGHRALVHLRLYCALQSKHYLTDFNTRQGQRA